MKILMGILLLDAFTLPYNVQAVHRYLVDTTCLELAKPSNKLSRLSCSDNTAYHCLPDWNFTRDVEVCGRWKWVPRGKKYHLFFGFWSFFMGMGGGGPNHQKTNLGLIINKP